MPEYKVVTSKIDPKDAVIVSAENNQHIVTQAKFALSFKGKEAKVGQVFKFKCFLEENEVGLSQVMMNKLGVTEGEMVTLQSVGRTISKSFSLIKQRIAQPGKVFTKNEIDHIISDITLDNMTPLEESVFLTSQMLQEWNIGEIECLTNAIAHSGQIINWGETVIFDKHSLGGVPGNKVTLLVVPIIAAAGLTIPKTSSRAITSPSGTADTMEALGCDIEFTIDEMVDIAQNIGGLIAWTGGLNIVPADEKIIRDVQYPLGIDPEPMMMASVISKKIAMGVKFLVLDIPCGYGTKVANLDTGKRLAHRFSELGRLVGIRIESGITYGSSPVGNAVGPALEAREALLSLKKPLEAPHSLVGKSTSLAGILLEMAGKAITGTGQELAYEILNSGNAYKKFQEILEAQNADPLLKPSDIEIGSATYEYLAPQSGYVVEIDNKVIGRAARAAGAPMDKRAGVYFHKKKDSVKRGETLFTLYSSNEKKLAAAEAELVKGDLPVTIEGMLLARE
ncbi:AMP phosphorylase [Candidatus Heimdallarchaeota archaeon B3_Heim]|nr:MAG: AMP phosphorylase [Candidatus Heimdallarchaeota archaeon B3_Heim]